MPGLGDALNKAFKDSADDLDALLQKAAEGEADSPDVSGDAAEAVAGPAAPSARQGVGESEKTSLFAAGESDMMAAGDVGADRGGAADEVDAAALTVAEGDLDALLKSAAGAAADEETPRHTSGSGITKRMVREAEGETGGEAGVSEGGAGVGAQDTATADTMTEPAAPTGQPGGGVPPATRTAALVSALPAEASPAPVEAPPPSAEPPREGKEEAPERVSSPASGPSVAAQPEAVVDGPEPVAPFAQFAASGVIRRKLKPGGSQPQAVEEPAPAPVVPRVVVRPKVDILKECREVASLGGAAGLSMPALAEGVSGLAKLAGSPGGPHMIVVCGATPRSGASTVAVATALCLARGERVRVLLAEADFRAPSLGRRLGGEEAGPGLRKVLASDAQLADAVTFSKEENLALLPAVAAGQDCRGELPALAGMLAKGNVDRLLEQLREQFDFVIFDAGAMAEWEGPEKLAGAAGCAVLTVRAGRTTRHVAATARKRLVASGARLAGALLTFA